LPNAAANASISVCIDSGPIQRLCYQAGAMRKSIRPEQVGGASVSAASVPP
jgi:hypothetical protein